MDLEDRLADRAQTKIALYEVKSRLFILGLMIVALTGCKGTKYVPMDDAYYWEKYIVASRPSTTSTTNETRRPSTTNETNEPKIEYINVQDTTVTIRIDR